MGDQSPIFRADVLRRAVTEWVDKGHQVVIEPDGRITINPKPPGTTPPDDFDSVDMTRPQRKRRKP